MDFLRGQYVIYGPVRIILTEDEYLPSKKSIIDKYYIWCGLRTISLAKSVT